LPKTIRSFNATDEINDLINESKLGKGKISDWINDKIKKGVLYDMNPTEKEEKTHTSVDEVRIRI